MRCDYAVLFDFLSKNGRISPVPNPHRPKKNLLGSAEFDLPRLLASKIPASPPLPLGVYKSRVSGLSRVINEGAPNLANVRLFVAHVERGKAFSCIKWLLINFHPF